MKTLIALAVLGATAALGLAVGSSNRAPAEPLNPTVVRYVNMNVIFDKAEMFAEDREEMKKRWEGWNTELGEMKQELIRKEKDLEAFPGAKKSTEYQEMIEAFETLRFQFGKRSERYVDQKNLQKIEYLLKWSADIEVALARFAKKNGIEVVLQNWDSVAGVDEGVPLQERYHRILYRPAAYLDPALDISLAIAAELK